MKELLASGQQSCLWYSCHRGTVLVACILVAKTVCTPEGRRRVSSNPGWGKAMHTHARSAGSAGAAASDQVRAHQVPDQLIDPLQRRLT